MTRCRFGLKALGVIAVMTVIGASQVPAQGQAPAAGGQRAGAPPAEPPKNLQVLPKDIPRQQLLQRMQAFSQGLGVQCGYCHVFEGANNPANDMASDVKTPKLVARVMIQMTDEINQKLAGNIKKPANEITSVGCMTCHRGEAIPKVPAAGSCTGTWRGRRRTRRRARASRSPVESGPARDEPALLHVQVSGHGRADPAKVHAGE